MQAKGGIPQICRGGGGVDVEWGPLWSPFQFFAPDIKSLQSGSNLGQCHVHPQLAAHLAFGCVDNAFGLCYRVVVYHAWHKRATCIVLHQQRRPLSSDCIESSWNTFCKTLTCLAVQLQFLGSTPVVDAIERRRLQQNIARSCVYFRFRTTHHARDRNRTRCIGDQQHRIVEFALDPVQGCHPLARFSPAYDNGWFAVSCFLSTLNK